MVLILKRKDRRTIKHEIKILKKRIFVISIKLDLFIIHKSNEAIIGSNMPFVICAKRIIEISFKPVVDIITPKKLISK